MKDAQCYLINIDKWFNYLYIFIKRKIMFVKILHKRADFIQVRTEGGAL